MNGTRNLTQQDIQTPSPFVNKEIAETRTTTEAKRSIPTIQPNFTTPKLKNLMLQQTIIQSTVNPSVAQKSSHIDYQTFLPVIKRSYKQQTLQRNNFAEHNYNYVNGPKTTKSETNIQIFAQSQKIPQQTSNTVNSYDQARSSQEQDIEQPDIFEPYTRNEQKRQPRNNPTSHNNNFQQQNPVNTQSHQRTQMQNKSHYHIIYNNTK